MYIIFISYGSILLAIGVLMCISYVIDKLWPDRTLTSKATSTPTTEKETPYRTQASVPEEPIQPEPKKEKKMSTPMNANQQDAVRVLLLTFLCAISLVAYGVFYPVLNDGLRVVGVIAIIVLAIGGMVSVCIWSEPVKK